MRIRNTTLLTVAVACAITFAGCKKADTSESGTSGGSPGPTGAAVVDKGSPLQQEAQAAVMADLAKHWAKTADGWTTALTQGSSGSPQHFLRRAKDLVVDTINMDDLTEADALNGVQCSCSVSLKPLTMREAGDPGQVAEGMSDPPAHRQKGNWSIWVQYQAPAIHAEKTKGQWKISYGGSLRAGTIPTASDFSNAGVK